MVYISSPPLGHDFSKQNPSSQVKDLKDTSVILVKVELLNYCFVSVSLKHTCMESILEYILFELQIMNN